MDPAISRHEQSLDDADTSGKSNRLCPCKVSAGRDFHPRRQSLRKYQPARRRSENGAAATGVDTTTFDTTKEAGAEHPPHGQTNPLRLAERKAGARAARPRVPEFTTHGRAVRAPF